MPLPTPNKDESEQEFISRAMGNETMKSEYPDEKQRLAVAYQKWRDRNKKKMSEDLWADDFGKPEVGSELKFPA